MKRALVLSGSGIKGLYQIGVFKALKKLHLKIDIITGNLIGAINGALFVEKKLLLQQIMWQDIIKKKLLKDDELLIDEDYLKKFINEQKLRNSKISYGLITYSYKNKKPLLLTKESIPNGELVEYILASSIKNEEKKGKNNITNDYYDNLPLNLAIEMGADEVIAVDLNAIGFRKEHNNKLVKIKEIKCKEKINLTNNFTSKDIRRNIQIGYNDTLKYFKYYDGNNYTFKKDSLENNYQNIKELYEKFLKYLLQHNKSITKELVDNPKYNELFNVEDITKINESLEYLGEILDLDNTKVYNIENYNKLLIKYIKKINYLKVNKKLRGKMLIAYLYNKFISEENKKDIIKELFNISLTFPKEFLATVYLIVISKPDELLNSK